MTFATLPPVGYTTATYSGGAYEQQLNEKPIACKAMGLGQGRSNNVRAVASTGNISIVIGRAFERDLICYLLRSLSHPLADGNNESAQKALTCVKLCYLYKNIRSHFSLARNQFRAYNMFVTNSINEKSAQRLKHVGTLITQRPVKEDRMSLFPCILPQSQVYDHWNPINSWEFQS